MASMASRFLFIGGLHRSGTTLIARGIEAHPDVRGLSHAPVPEGEGVFLQGAIPHDACAGVPGRFAEDPASHMIERGPFDTAATRDRLRSDWDLWYPPGGAWRVEKSPVNLLRSRLYQQLFPAAQFLFVLRHPLAVARATAKWSGRTEAELLAHWDHAHRLLIEDLPHLHNWMIVRFEDFCAGPAVEMARITAFLRLDDAEAPADVRQGQNSAYVESEPPRGDSRLAAAFGYALDAPEPVGPNPHRGAHWFRDIREAIA